MLKRGTFAIYHGKEYSLDMDPSTGEEVLLTNDVDAQNEGFVPKPNSKRYMKKIQMDELDYVYEYKLYALYHGRKFLVASMKNNNASLIHFGLEGADEVKAMGFEFVDRWYFEKFVPVSEIEEFREYTVPQQGYALPPGHQGEPLEA